MDGVRKNIMEGVEDKQESIIFPKSRGQWGRKWKARLRTRMYRHESLIEKWMQIKELGCEGGS